jgi:lipoprotein signal peptidase
MTVFGLRRDALHVSSPHILLSRIALLVAGGDLLTKFVARRVLGLSTTVADGWVGLTVVHNDAGAFGWSLGSYTWQLNLALTLAAVVFVVPVTRDLTSVDRRAPVALGLIAGGALGNLASLVTSPYGVVDFIQVSWANDRALVLNVADAAAYTGLALLARTAYLIVRAMRDERIAPARYVAPELRLGSVFTVKAEAKAALRSLRKGPRRSRVTERLTTDWSQVVEVPQLADAPDRSSRDSRAIRPLGVPTRRKVRLESLEHQLLDKTLELPPP